MSDSHEHEEPRIAEPGHQLRQQRESAGFSLQDISDKTLISAFRLQALEDQDFDNIGGRAYLAGYTRAYAKVLGIDSEAYVRAFESLLAAEQDKPDPLLEDSVAPPTGGLLRRIWFAVLAVLLLALVAGGLVLLIGGDVGGRSVLDQESVPPAFENQVSSQSAVSSITSNDDSIATQFESETEIDRPFASMRDGGAVRTSQVDDVVEGPVASDQQNAGVESASIASENSLVADLALNFSDECWVEVLDASGAVLAARLAQPGNELQLSGPPPFDIHLGNARAVEITLNGSPVQVPVRAGRNTSRFTVGQRL